MATIENAAASQQALADWKASLRTMQQGELLAQQLIQRGAENALVSLQKFGLTAENCALMLANLGSALEEIQAAATARGITLLDFDSAREGSST